MSGFEERVYRSFEGMETPNRRQRDGPSHPIPKAHVGVYEDVLKAPFIVSFFLRSFLVLINVLVLFH